MQIWYSYNEAETIILSVRNFLIARIMFHISVLQEMTFNKIIAISNFNKRHHHTTIAQIRHFRPALLLLSFSGLPFCATSHEKYVLG